MIVSASRRTDIPAYYSHWFLNRIKEQYVLVRNPMNIHQISKVNLSPDVVDCIVFWTKNPEPMIDKLDKLKGYNFYFQFTLNSYSNDIEKNIPSKNRCLIETFKRLSAKIGAERTIWRYDPIFLNQKYTAEYHSEYFEKLAKHLSNYTEKCTISFMDFYPTIKNNIVSLGITEMTKMQQWDIAEQLSRIAFKYGLKMDTCCEGIDLSKLGIRHAKCIDGDLISRIIGSSLSVEKDKNQRLECGCVSSIDIGLYNTCCNGCKYCYANHSLAVLQKNREGYDMNSPLLCSHARPGDIISERSVRSLKDNQISLLPT
ncbi:hypothetical protein OXPF_36540 [Oxobacter pfennigii]|uniref:DUF1848 domain-containing protein n=1 Tax=Oxobacter pfennigii TaxID=36849 RepID=A0A0P8Y886_9CLOT|nr:DUF1848 domain-containing protein [Oxobacter pfennigii]KPU42886.1 hypothetical protein OXPF_36540 [Oxobacter pfennigii]